MSFEKTIEFIKEEYKDEEIIEALLTYKDFLEECGIVWDAEPICGGCGCIFDTVDPDWILKMTFDKDEVALFRILNQEKIESGFAKIREIYDLSHNGKDVYIIIKERVKIFPEDKPPDIADEYINFMHVYYQEMNDVRKKGKNLRKAAYALGQFVFDEVEELFFGLMSLAKREYYLRDIDLDNVGLNCEGDIVVFDAQLIQDTLQI